MNHTKKNSKLYVPLVVVVVVPLSWTSSAWAKFASSSFSLIAS